MFYIERKLKVAAIEWTASNLTEVEDFLATLPKLDSYYANFTDVVATQTGDHLNITWDGGSSPQFEPGDWVVEGLHTSSPAGLVTSEGSSGHQYYNKINT